MTMVRITSLEIDGLAVNFAKELVYAAKCQLQTPPDQQYQLWDGLADALGLTGRQARCLAPLYHALICELQDSGLK